MVREKVSGSEGSGPARRRLSSRERRFAILARSAWSCASVRGFRAVRATPCCDDEVSVRWSGRYGGGGNGGKASWLAWGQALQGGETYGVHGELLDAPGERNRLGNGDDKGGRGGVRARKDVPVRELWAVEADAGVG